MTQKPDIAVRTNRGLTLEVRTLHLRRFQGQAIIFVGFTDGRSVTLRVTMARVRALRDLLSTVC